jgi:hypothetical protein
MISLPVYASGNRTQKERIMWNYIEKINTVGYMVRCLKYRKVKENVFDPITIFFLGVIAGSTTGMLYLWVRYMR